MISYSASCSGVSAEKTMTWARMRRARAEAVWARTQENSTDSAREAAWMTASSRRLTWRWRTAVDVVLGRFGAGGEAVLAGVEVAGLGAAFAIFGGQRGGWGHVRWGLRITTNGANGRI